MRGFICDTLIATFTTILFVATTAMVSYWVYKFKIEDNDVCLVDYKTFKEATDTAFPVSSICLTNPVHDTKLKDIGHNISSRDYL